MIPLGGQRTNTVLSGGSGEDPKVSFRAKDAGWVTAPFFWICSTQFHCKLFKPDCTFFFFLNTPSGPNSSCKTFTFDRQDRIQITCPYTHAVENFLPSKNTDIVQNSLRMAACSETQRYVCKKQQTAEELFSVASQLESIQCLIYNTWQANSGKQSCYPILRSSACVQLQENQSPEVQEAVLSALGPLMQKYCSTSDT